MVNARISRQLTVNANVRFDYLLAFQSLWRRWPMHKLLRHNQNLHFHNRMKVLLVYLHVRVGERSIKAVLAAVATEYVGVFEMLHQLVVGLAIDVAIGALQVILRFSGSDNVVLVLAHVFVEHRLGVAGEMTVATHTFEHMNELVILEHFFVDVGSLQEFHRLVVRIDKSSGRGGHCSGDAFCINFYCHGFLNSDRTHGFRFVASR